jgi:hypothetical protein
VTVYDPAADGVNETSQEATSVVPVVPVAASVQLPNDTVAAELMKLTVPSGAAVVLAGGASDTVAVHVVAVPVVTDAGEHFTAVDV